jgi:hypothetical protein
MPSKQTNLPDWLPKPLELNPQGLDATCHEAYFIFRRDFIERPFTFNNKPLHLFHTPAYLGYIESFWHVITKEVDSKENSFRIPDFERVLRIPWLRPLLTDGYRHQELLLLKEEFKKGFKKQVYVWWIEDIGHLFVLKERSKCFELISAYHINPKQKSFESKLIKRYQILPVGNIPTSSKDCIALLKQKGVPYC